MFIWFYAPSAMLIDMLKYLCSASLILLAFNPGNPSPRSEKFDNTPAAPASSWQLPFTGPHRLVRPYLQPNSDYSAGHRGVDYEISKDEPLFAPADGVITVAQWIVDRPVLTLRHGMTLVSELEPACATVEVGQIVLKGERIGTACAPNSEYMSHCPDVSCLHFSLRIAGKYLSPLALIGGLNPSRLLPYARG